MTMTMRGRRSWGRALKGEGRTADETKAARANRHEANLPQREEQTDGAAAGAWGVVRREQGGGRKRGEERRGEQRREERDADDECK
jgi:hypothetical protein